MTTTNPISPTSPQQDSCLFTYDEAATYLSIPKGTLYWLVSENRIPHYRLGARTVRFRRSDLDAWLSQHAR